MLAFSRDWMRVLLSGGSFWRLVVSEYFNRTAGFDRRLSFGSRTAEGSNSSVLPQRCLDVQALLGRVGSGSIVGFGGRRSFLRCSCIVMESHYEDVAVRGCGAEAEWYGLMVVSTLMMAVQK